MLPLAAALANRRPHPSQSAGQVAAVNGLVQASTFPKAGVLETLTRARVPKATKYVFGITLPILHVSF